ncbi:MAG: GatB/YqeY domain-containing protein [Chloroflexota bacterium]
MMNLQERIQQDVKNAMRSGDKARLSVLRMALASLKNAQIEISKEAYDAQQQPTASASPAVLSEEAVQQTIAREVKRRRDAEESYRQANREDLAEQEASEAAILEEYLPQKLSADELRPLIQTTISELGVSGMADMGKVMPILMQEYKERADGRLISQIAREILSQQS